MGHVKVRPVSGATGLSKDGMTFKNSFNPILLVLQSHSHLINGSSLLTQRSIDISVYYPRYFIILAPISTLAMLLTLHYINPFSAKLIFYAKTCLKFLLKLFLP